MNFRFVKLIKFLILKFCFLKKRLKFIFSEENLSFGTKSKETDKGCTKNQENNFSRRNDYICLKFNL